MDAAAIKPGFETGGFEGFGEAGGLIRQFYLDQEDARASGEGGNGPRAHQSAGVDHDERVADAFDLAEEMGGHEDRNTELVSDAADEGEHVITPGRIEAVGRLIEEEQARVVHQRLGEFHALLHAG